MRSSTGHRPLSIKVDYHGFKRIPVDPVWIEPIGRLAAKIPGVERRALGATIIAPNPLDTTPMRVESCMWIKIILAAHAPEGSIAVAAIRYNDIVAYLKTGTERVEHLNIGVLTGCLGIFLLVPGFADFFKIVETLVGPVNVAAPAQVDQPTIEALADSIFLTVALARAIL